MPAVVRVPPSDLIVVAPVSVMVPRPGVVVGEVAKGATGADAGADHAHRFGDHETRAVDLDRLRPW